MNINEMLLKLVKVAFGEHKYAQVDITDKTEIESVQSDRKRSFSKLDDPIGLKLRQTNS